MAVKSLVLNPRNPERGYPQINSLVVLLDSDSGLPLAVMDGNCVAALRQERFNQSILTLVITKPLPLSNRRGRRRRIDACRWKRKHRL